MAGPRLRIAFFGTPDFAVPTLSALAASHDVVVVITQPDRPKGRGQHPQAPPVKQLATGLGIPILQPDRLRDGAFLDLFGSHRPDLGVVAAYGKILPEAVLTLPRLGMVNVHASILPRYRGAAPVHRAVMNGDDETGVTIMRIVQALDAGPMLAVARRPIGPDETSEDVERDLARLGAQLLVTTIPGIADGTVAARPQDERLSTYAPRLTKEEGRIDWIRAARDIHNQVRGLHPWPHAYTFFNQSRLIVLRTSPDETPERVSAPPGSVLRASGDQLSIAAGHRTAIRLLELQAEGKRPMKTREFLAGHGLPAGSTFT